MKYHKNTGFTLLELLVVLSSVTFILGIMFIKIDSFAIKNELNKELELLGTIVQSVQTKAMITDQKLNIKFNKNQMEVIANGQKIYQHDVDKDILIKTNFPGNKIGINKNGNLSRAGTIYYTKEKISKKIIFTIGSGRYRII